MKAKYIIFFLGLFSSFFFSCNSPKINTKAQTICFDSIDIDNSIRELISSYIKSMPQYESYTLICNPRRNNNMYFGNDYLLGPSYSGLFKKDQYPYMFITCESKKVFIKNNSEELIRFKTNIITYEQHLVKRGVDSIKNELGWILKDGNVLYYYKALYFSYSSKGKLAILSNRADTIFLPQYNKTIQFE